LIEPKYWMNNQVSDTGSDDPLVTLCHEWTVYNV